VRPGRAADQSPPSSAAVMEELYLYPPSGPHRACNGITLPFFKYVIATNLATCAGSLNHHQANS